ncbi:cell division protein PerM [Oerskovia turbata]
MSTPTQSAAGRRAPRTVEEPPRGPRSLEAPRRWLSGVVAALQALALSLAVVILPAVVAFLASSTGTGAGGTGGWGQSVSVAVGFWLLAHGVPLAAAGTSITLVPLGLTFLLVLICFASARRSAHTAVSAWAVGVATYALAAFVIALLAGSAPGGDVLFALLGGAVVAGVGFGAGILSRPDAPRVADLTAVVDPYVPPVVRLGARAGVLGVTLLLGVSAVVTGVWVVSGRATSGDIIVGLAPGALGGLILAFSQLAVVPNLVLWVGSWIAGPGFVVGEGSRFTTSGSEPGALPAVPLLGALPGPEWTTVAASFAPALVVVLGIVAGAFVWRRCGGHDARWADLGLALVGVALASGLLVVALQAVAGGAVGPGRMAHMGAPALLAGGLVAAEITGGAALALVWGKAAVTERVRHRHDAHDASVDPEG